MTTSGLTIGSPKIGQTITFLRTAQDSAGEELVIQARMRPGAFMPPHRHLHQEETFEVLEGMGTFNVAGRKIVAAAGERVRIAGGVAHRFRNTSSDDVVVRATLRPAMRVRGALRAALPTRSSGEGQQARRPGPVDHDAADTRVPRRVLLPCGGAGLASAFARRGATMKLYVCWGTFQTFGRGHPCRNALDALHDAGHDPEIIRSYGWGLLPAAVNRSEGRRRARRATGKSWLPLLLTDDGELIAGSAHIKQWASQQPARSS